ncbi:MAG: alkaline phosphatase D family protein [Sandaracinobacteroides sp.]
MHDIGRRQLLSGLGALAAAPAIAQVAGPSFFAEYPFALGVASGDPASDGMVIWTRLAPDPLNPGEGLPRRALPVRYEVAETAGFQTLVAQGEAMARPELGHSVHVTLAGLLPGRPYFYRFIAGGERSPTGRTRTLPEPGASVGRVRLGVVGCQDYQAGLYTAFQHLAREDLDAVFHYGDYLYEGGPRRSQTDWATGGQLATVRRHSGPTTFSLDDYRARYGQIRADIDLQNAHAAAPFLMSFDDHEVVNNWVSDIAPDDTPRELFLLRRQAAMQAWYEFMPVRADALPALGTGLSGPWRSYRFGKLLDARLLNTRNFRSNQPCDDKFGSYCPEVRDPRAEVLGRAQEDWLVKGLTARPATWNALLQQIMMMNLDRARAETLTVNPDSWAGYAVPRDRLLERLGPVPNLIVLTGDEHQHFAGEVRPTTAAPESPASAVEFVTTSAASGSDGPGERKEHAEWLRRNPGLKYIRDERGYTVMTVTPEAWAAECRTVSTVRTPGGSIATHASWRVPAGAARLERG